MDDVKLTNLINTQFQRIDRKLEDGEKKFDKLMISVTKITTMQQIHNMTLNEIKISLHGKVNRKELGTTILCISFIIGILSFVFSYYK